MQMPTTRDIARNAHVSIATVSRVLNNSLSISKSTRETVEKAIKELHYSPPVCAKAYAPKRVKTIALLVPDIKNLYYPAVIRGFENVLAKNDFNTIICYTDENPENEEIITEALTKKGIDGLAFLGSRQEGKTYKYIDEIRKKIPVILINDFILGSKIYSIMADEADGAYKAIDYLVSLGHSKIAFFRNSFNLTTFSYKFTGYKKALSDNGIAINDKYIFRDAPFEEGGYNSAKALLRLKDRPTAIFAADDQTAIGAVKALMENKIAIPGDISIIGFANIPISAHIYPGLTTVNQFPFKTGELAAQVFLRINNRESMPQKRFLIEPQLEIRNSCTKNQDNTKRKNQ